jgi:hypothetical protein
MAEATSRTKAAAAAAAAAVLVAIVAWMRCGRGQSETRETGGVSSASPSASATSAAAPHAGAEAAPGGLSAPIAAVHVDGGAVVVAALDVGAKGIRARRIDVKDVVVDDRIVLADVAWSTDSDLKLFASPSGVALTWRGLRKGKAVRELVTLGPDLSPRGEPVEIAAASCATRDAFWWSDGSHAVVRPWDAGSHKVHLPKDKDISLLCSQTRAFALLEEDERTSLLALGDGGTPVTMVRENDFGEDDQRELSEYTIGDDVGVVRLAASGAVAVRELADGGAGPLRKLKTSIGRDDDIVAVDASQRLVTIVYTQDVSEGDDGGAHEPGATVTCPKVSALRVDRQSQEESVVELSPPKCGREVGPFFTNALGDAVSVAWPERAGAGGRARAPIIGLAHARVAPGAAPTLGQAEQPSDALVDAGCDATQCYAVALVRPEGADGMAPGIARVIRY